MDGDRQQFAAFYAEHQPALWRYLVRIGADHATADDITQESFVKWWTSPGRFLGGAPSRAYLFRIATRRLIDCRRRQSRELAWTDEEGAPDEGSPESLPISPAWRRLSLRERQLLWLAHAEGFDHAEIAQACALRQSSVKVLLHRARAALRTKIEQAGSGRYG